MKLKIEDLVIMKDWGTSYPNSSKWFANRINILRPEWIARYAYDDHTNYDTRRYTDQRQYSILYIDESDKKALISDSIDYGKVYLVSLDALVLANPPKKMTVSEIEEELGYRVEIVAEKED